MSMFILLAEKLLVAHLSVLRMLSLLFIYSDFLSVYLTDELEKSTHSDMKVTNITDKHVAFKVCFLP